MVMMVAITDTAQADRADRIIKRLDRLKSERGTLDSHLQEVAERVVPRKSYVTVKRREGQKVITMNSELFDPTAVFANQFMAAGLISHLAPPNSRWHAIKARDEELNKSEAVKVSLAKLTTLLHEEFAVSNFYMQLNELMLDIGWAGQSCIEVKEGKKTALNFNVHHVSEFHIAENSDRLVDTVYYEFEYTARQAVQEWGTKNVGTSVLEAYNSDNKKDIDKKFKFIQEVAPREDFDSFPARPDRRPINEVFVAVKDKIIVAEDGYYEMPKLTPRWSKNSNEVNGRSQGMFALPWIKRINEVSKDLTQARQMGLRPPTLVPDDGFLGNIRSVPGAIWPYRATYAANPNAIRQFPVTGNTKEGMEELKWLEEKIQKAFFNDLFVWLAEQGGTKTAYEISQRIEEKHTMIVPPIGRLQSEGFNGIISRSIAVLGRAGKLRGILAPELLDQGYEIQYISKLALALRILETRSITATFDVVAPIGERNPQVFDNFNDDKTVRGVAERMGYPPDMMNTPEERDDIRLDRAEALAAERAAELAAGAADAIPKLQKETEENSPLEAMAEAL